MFDKFMKLWMKKVTVDCSKGGGAGMFVSDSNKKSGIVLMSPVYEKSGR